MVPLLAAKRAPPPFLGLNGLVKQKWAMKKRLFHLSTKRKNHKFKYLGVGEYRTMSTLYAVLRRSAMVRPSKWLRNAVESFTFSSMSLFFSISSANLSSIACMINTTRVDNFTPVRALTHRNLMNLAILLKIKIIN